MSVMRHTTYAKVIEEKEGEKGELDEQKLVFKSAGDGYAMTDFITLDRDGSVNALEMQLHRDVVASTEKDESASEEIRGTFSIRCFSEEKFLDRNLLLCNGSQIQYLVDNSKRNELDPSF